MGKKLATCFFVLLFVLLILLVSSTVSFAEDDDENATGLAHRNVRCRLNHFPACYLVSLPCPRTCRRSCLMDCSLCRPVCECDRPGAVCQDPRFVGGDGVTFYFHGHRDGDFCLVSDRHLHINAHFIGKRDPALTRDFTWVQSLAVLLPAAATATAAAHNLLVAAGKTAAWDDATDRLDLAFDGQPIALPPSEGATWHSPTSPRVSVTRTRAANAVAVEAEGVFEISAAVVPITAEESRVHRYGVTADDCFAHLDLGFRFYGLSEEVSGVLGRTYRANYTSSVRVGSAMPVVGGEKEFLASDLFAADCAASRFNGGSINQQLIKLRDVN